MRMLPSSSVQTSRKNKEFSIDSLVSKAGRSPSPTSHSPGLDTRRYLPKPEAHPATAVNGLFPHGRSIPGGSPTSSSTISRGTASPTQPHPAFMGAGTTLSPSQPGQMVLPPIHGFLPQSPTGLPAGFPHPEAVRPNPAFLHPALLGGHHPAAAAMFPNGLPNSPPGLANKDNFPLYTWLLARHSSYLNHGFGGR